MNDFEKIKNTIESETAKRPASLSKENICDMLGEKNIMPVPVKKRVNTKKIVSLAAALIVTVSAVAAVYFNSDTKAPAVENTDEQQSTSAETTAATTAAPKAESDEYKEIENYFLSLHDRIKLYTAKESYNYGYAVPEQAVTVKAALSADNEDAAPAVKNKGIDTVNEAQQETADSLDGSYGKTNTQVEGVDEADIIKNDGRYIYSKTDRCTVSITDTANMSLASNIE
ncbi:MAG: beta-propeller domain-containing protein, partial [Clostridia bacterium]|nr:beta-propeller domain-containing protein [Clostridia bacterium]